MGSLGKINTENLEFRIDNQSASPGCHLRNGDAFSNIEFARRGNELFMRKVGGKLIYKATNLDVSGDRSCEIEYECTECGHKVAAVVVIHKLVDFSKGLQENFSQKSCAYEAVPFCPKCEKKPDIYGLLLEYKG